MDYIVWLALFKNGVEKRYRQPIDRFSEDYVRKMRDDVGKKKKEGEMIAIMISQGAVLLDSTQICAIEIVSSSREN